MNDVVRRPNTIRSFAAACSALLLTYLVAESLTSPADAQGMRIFRPITRSAIDQRRINEASRVSLRVIRPRLDIAPGKVAAPVAALALSDDRNLMAVLLQDGTVRLWDLDRGVQLGGVEGEGIVSVGLSGAGRRTQAIGLRRDGGLIGLLPVESGLGTFAVSGVSQVKAQSVLSADGNTLVVKIFGLWHLLRGGRIFELENAARDFQPILSRDGMRLAYRLTSGEIAAARVTGQGLGASVPIGDCQEGIPVTVGAFGPDAHFVVLGDEQGNVCLKRIPGPGERLQHSLGSRRGHSSAVRAVTVDREGSHIATYDGSGAVRVWSAIPSIRLAASFTLGSGHTGAIALDSKRRWILAGKANGTVSIFSYMDSEKRQIATLISLSDGNWVILDRKGRFDGPQGGGDALAWAGETVAETLPVNAFTERYFEPGLLAKLDDASPRYLNRQIRDIREEGYILPPAVYIEPLEPSGSTAEDPVSVRVRLDDPRYPRSAVSEVRLYHNGKLTPKERMRGDLENGVFEFKIRLLPGENSFRAVGIGPGGVEGRAATAPSIAVEDPKRERARMRIISIGINDYTRPDWELSYSRNDARAVVSALREQGKRLFEKISHVTLLDSAASADAIEEKISHETANPQDILVVFFAGHGYAFQRDGEWEWYLFPYTRAWNSQQAVSEEVISRYGVSSKNLLRELTKRPERQVFLILDSCRSGALVDAIKGLDADDAAERKVLRKIARVGGIHVLAASRADEDAVELLSVPHGALTFLFLEGIRGKADGNRDNTITVREMVEYTVREMPLLSRRLVSESISQMPVGYSHGSDFGLARL